MLISLFLFPTPRIKEHIVKGIDNGEAFLDMLEGRNFGKAVISLE